MLKVVTSAAAIICLSAGTAFAIGPPVPIPVAGATGPIGLGVALVAYAGYRFWTRNR